MTNMKDAEVNKVGKNVRLCVIANASSLSECLRQGEGSAKNYTLISVHLIIGVLSSSSISLLDNRLMLLPGLETFLIRLN